MVTLRTIATRCGVDVSTISKVLHGRDIRVTDETRNKILTAAKELDYRPNALARSLRLRQSGAIVMALRDTTNIVYPEIIEGVQEAAEKRGVCLFLVKSATGNTAGASLISLVQEGRVDGILWDDLPYKAFAQELIDSQVPFVCLNAYSNIGGQSVTLNDQEGFTLQANYLADLGHSRIGFVGVKPEESDVSTLCREAFRTALESRGLTLAEKDVFHCRFEGDDVFDVAKQLTAHDRPTAIAAASILTAKRLCNTLNRLNIRVPQDISVIGYHDDNEAAWNVPALTTVKMPSREQGKVAVECLLDLVSGTAFLEREIKERPLIIERESCAPPSVDTLPRE
jgi:LacI family transcriptional regulator